MPLGHNTDPPRTTLELFKFYSDYWQGIEEGLYERWGRPWRGRLGCDINDLPRKYTPHPDPPPSGGREILDLAKCKAAGGFSLAGATKYCCHERLP